MEKLRELMQEQWLPELKDLSKECDDVMEKKRANSHGSSRTKQARQEEANKALESIDDRCKRIQVPFLTLHIHVYAHSMNILTICFTSMYMLASLCSLPILRQSD